MRGKGKKCYAVKGYAGKTDIPLIYKKSVGTIKEKTPDGKERVVERTVLWILGVDSGKEDITNRLKITEPGEGYCHFPSDDGRGYDAAYYEGLTSEHMIVKQVRGKLIKNWEKERGKANEPFDLFNYNYAVVEILKPSWDVLEDLLNKGVNYMQQKKTTGRRRNQKGIEI
jgi:phage terminase large subunit GpA-like protein